MEFEGLNASFYHPFKPIAAQFIDDPCYEIDSLHHRRFGLLYNEMRLILTTDLQETLSVWKNMFKTHLPTLIL